ncbi:hypothetical protein ACE6H2_003654 [Prunus campanulata]
MLLFMLCFLTSLAHVLHRVTPHWVPQYTLAMDLFLGFTCGHFHPFLPAVDPNSFFNSLPFIDGEPLSSNLFYHKFFRNS